MAITQFWNMPLTAVQSALQAGNEGLTVEEAQRRADQHGLNQLHSRQRSLLHKFLLRFSNPLVLILLSASAISALLHEKASVAIIGVMVLFSVTLDFIQEYRAERAVEQLRKSVAVRARIKRNGQCIEVPVTAVVPGDVVLLSAGDLVPADARVLEARDLFVNQSVLTGEGFPVEKHAMELHAPSTALDDALNAVFMGTSVISGTATVMVCNTGMDTQIGDVADLLLRPEPENSFQRGMRHFGLFIMRMTVFLVLFVLLMMVMLHRPVMESFLFAVALAVGLTPELLPMVTTVTLAHGALIMSRKQVVVKRLAAIQSLGSMDVLCTDKTGTLTEAQIAVVRTLDCNGNESADVFLLAFLNSHFETGLHGPLDEAILKHHQIDIHEWKKIDEVPFDFNRRRVSVLLDNGHERLLMVKGAPEDILKLSTQYAASLRDPALPMTEDNVLAFQALHDQCARSGMRLLGVAFRRVVGSHQSAVVDDESDLVFIGMIAFLDPPKNGIETVLQSLAERGVALKIVTGDNELVTRHLCEAVNFHITEVLNGSELAAMDDTGLRARVTAANVFCRVTPAQKDRIILALKQRGHVVGYLGDGINDAPALHAADVGISVDSAVDVARQAADMIMLKHDLGVLQEGVMEGRRTFANIMKYIMMGTSSNFGNMFSMAIAAAWLPFLPMLPVQVLLNNLLYDLSEIAIPMDRVDPQEVKKPRDWDIGFVRRFMWRLGLISSIFDVLTFYVLLRMFNAGAAEFHTGWFIESAATQVLVIFVIRTRYSPFSHRPHPLLTLISLLAVAVALMLPLTALGGYFGFVVLPARFFVILFIMVVAYLVIVEVFKRRFYRGEPA